MIAVLNLQRFVRANSPACVEMIGDNFLRRLVVLKNFSQKISTKKPVLSFQKTDFLSFTEYAIEAVKVFDFGVKSRDF